MNCFRSVLAFLLLLVGGLGHAAQDEPAPAADPAHTAAGNAVSLVGLGFGGGPGAFGVGTTLVAADDALWPQPQWDAVLPLRAEWLKAVRDRTGLGWVDKRGPRDRRAPIAFAAENPEEGMAYCDALAKARRTRTDVFAQAARRNLSSRDVLSAPRELRGEVVRVEGTLRLVNAQSVPLMLQKLGIEKLYEGWVIDKSNPRNTWCIVFTELPEPLRQETNQGLAVEVEFDGYFLKTLLYEAQGTKSNPNRIEEAPLILGRAPVVLATTTAAGGDPWSELIVPGLSILAVVTLGALGLLTWGFRRGDRRLHRRLEANRKVVIPDQIPSEHD